MKPPIIEGSTVAFEFRVIDKLETGDQALHIREEVAIDLPGRGIWYSIHYRKLVSINTKSNLNQNPECD